MQMQCKCIANAKLVHIVCCANAMQNYANKNKTKTKGKIKIKIKEKHTDRQSDRGVGGVSDFLYFFLKIFFSVSPRTRVTPA